jgi:hypothetical protein
MAIPPTPLATADAPIAVVRSAVALALSPKAELFAAVASVPLPTAVERSPVAVLLTPHSSELIPVLELQGAVPSANAAPPPSVRAKNPAPANNDALALILLMIATINLLYTIW